MQKSKTLMSSTLMGQLKSVREKLAKAEDENSKLQMKYEELQKENQRLEVIDSHNLELIPL